MHYKSCLKTCVLKWFCSSAEMESFFSPSQAEKLCKNYFQYRCNSCSYRLGIGPHVNFFCSSDFKVRILRLKSEFWEKKSQNEVRIMGKLSVRNQLQWQSDLRVNEGGKTQKTWLCRLKLVLTRVIELTEWRHSHRPPL